MSLNDPQNDAWLNAVSESVASYRRLIDSAVEQLTDEELRRRPCEGFNSVAAMLRHLGGNLQSRWTDFLTADGEKPTRDRESEFRDWEGDRASLMAYFEQGWNRLDAALNEIRGQNPQNVILIRGEPHTLSQALVRSVTHIAYHVGQIVMVARMVHDGAWEWLTIAPGQSDLHNQKTWGTKSSRLSLGGGTGV